MSRLRPQQIHRHHQAICNRILDSKSDALFEYTLQFGAYHLAVLQEAEKLFELAHSSSFLEAQFRISHHHSWSLQLYRYALSLYVHLPDKEADLFTLSYRAAHFAEDKKKDIPQIIEELWRVPEQLPIALERLSVLDDASFFKACILLIWIELNRSHRSPEELQDRIQAIEKKGEPRFFNEMTLQWDNLLDTDFMVTWTLRCAEQMIDVHPFLICSYGNVDFVSRLLDRGIYLDQDPYNLLLKMVFQIQQNTVKRLYKNQIQFFSKKAAARWEKHHQGAYTTRIESPSPLPLMRNPQSTIEQILEVLQEDPLKDRQLFWAQTHLLSCVQRQDWPTIYAMCSKLKHKKEAWSFVCQKAYQFGVQAEFAAFLLTQPHTEAIIREFINLYCQDHHWDEAIDMAHRLPAGEQSAYAFRQIIQHAIPVDEERARSLLSEVTDPYQKTMAELEYFRCLSPQSESYKGIARRLFTAGKAFEGAQKLTALANLTAILYTHNEMKAYKNIGKVLAEIPSGRMAVTQWNQIIDIFVTRGCIKPAESIITSKLKQSEHQSALDSILIALLNKRDYDEFFQRLSRDSLNLDKARGILVSQNEIEKAIRLLSFLRQDGRIKRFIEELVCDVFKNVDLTVLRSQQWVEFFPSGRDKALWKLELAKFWLTLQEVDVARGLMTSLIDREWPILVQNEDFLVCTQILSVFPALDMTTQVRHLFQQLLNPQKTRIRQQLWHWTKILPVLSPLLPQEALDAHLKALPHKTQASTLRDMATVLFKQGNIDRALSIFNQISSEEAKKQLLYRWIGALKNEDRIEPLMPSIKAHSDADKLSQYAQMYAQVESDFDAALAQYLNTPTKDRHFGILEALILEFEKREDWAQLEALLSKIEPQYRQRYTYKNMVTRLLHRYLHLDKKRDIQRVQSDHQAYLSSAWFYQNTIEYHIGQKNRLRIVSLLQDENNRVNRSKIIHHVLLDTLRLLEHHPTEKQAVLQIMEDCLSTSEKRIDLFTLLALFDVPQRELHFDRLTAEVKAFKNLLKEQDAWASIIEVMAAVDFDWALSLTEELLQKQQVRTDKVFFVLYHVAQKKNKARVLSLLHRMQFSESFYHDFFQYYLSKCTDWQHLKLALLYTPFSLPNTHKIVFQAAYFLLTQKRETEALTLIESNPFFQI